MTRADELAEGEPLLIRIIRQGRFERPLPALDSIRERCRENLKALPEHLLALDAKSDYLVAYSDALEADAHRLMIR